MHFKRPVALPHTIIYGAPPPFPRPPEYWGMTLAGQGYNTGCIQNGIQGVSKMMHFIVVYISVIWPLLHISCPKLRKTFYALDV